MAVEQVLHMNGGEGDTSYANNSTFQVMINLPFCMLYQSPKALDIVH